MYFIPPFKLVNERLSTVKINGTSRIQNTYEEFLSIVKLLLRGTAFDEAWYLSKYPDVKDAVKSGVFKSGRHHFIEVGYFEGRRPRDFEIDEKWYLSAYPDVAEGIDKGEIKSAYVHFNDHGYEEGRFPSEI